MTIRFRRSIKILPGVRVNIGKTGISTTIGTRGAHVTVNSHGQRRTTVGLPGTGLSMTQLDGGHQGKQANQADQATTDAKPKSSGWRTVGFWVFCIALLIFFMSLLNQRPH
jgi:disulfide bond formation protein DsbB